MTVIGARLPDQGFLFSSNQKKSPRFHEGIFLPSSSIQQFFYRFRKQIHFYYFNPTFFLFR